MSDIKTFHLPDLGEGLPDATIVEWLVKEGTSIKLDDPLVSMETAKAVVEVPSPYSGTLSKLHGQAGDVIITGAPLAEFSVDPQQPQRAEAEPSGHHHAPSPPSGFTDQADKAQGLKAATPHDTGTVVGTMESSDRLHSEQAVTVAGIKAMPAVRALAKKLRVDLSQVTPSGATGVVTLADVRKAAESGTAPLRTESAGITAAQASASTAPARRTAVSATGKPMRTTPPGPTVLGQPEQLKGMRRTMARVMADSHAQIVPASIVDDADLHAWQPDNDITVRLLRALVVACKTVPMLNAWFDGENLTQTLHPHVDVGLAVDTEDGLFVPAIRNADHLDAVGLRAAVNRVRAQVQDRSIPADQLKGYTIMLSNFGMFAGRYASPVIVPPCVAILGAGRLRHEVVPVMGGIATHRMMPLSLTFDHRAATGGEAARFLRAVMDDLALAS